MGLSGSDKIGAKRILDIANRTIGKLEDLKRSGKLTGKEERNLSKLKEFADKVKRHLSDDSYPHTREEVEVLSRITGKGIDAAEMGRKRSRLNFKKEDVMKNAWKERLNRIGRGDFGLHSDKELSKMAFEKRKEAWKEKKDGTASNKAAKDLFGKLGRFFQ